VNHF
jgi:hypothetical protein